MNVSGYLNSICSVVHMCRSSFRMQFSHINLTIKFIQIIQLAVAVWAGIEKLFKCRTFPSKNKTTKSVGSGERPFYFVNCSKLRDTDFGVSVKCLKVLRVRAVSPAIPCQTRPVQASNFIDNCELSYSLQAPQKKTYEELEIISFSCPAC